MLTGGCWMPSRKFWLGFDKIIKLMNNNVML